MEAAIVTLVKTLMSIWIFNDKLANSPQTTMKRVDWNSQSEKKANTCHQPFNLSSAVTNLSTCQLLKYFLARKIIEHRSSYVQKKP